MSPFTNLAINTLARQLLVDVMEIHHDEAMDGHERTSTLAGIPDGFKDRVVKEARDIAANLGPSPAATQAAEHLLTERRSAIPTPVPPGQNPVQSDTPMQ